MKRFSVVVLILLFLCGNAFGKEFSENTKNEESKTKQSNLEIYRENYKFFDYSAECIQKKYIELDNMFNDKTKMYQLMTPDGVAYLQAKSHILQMMIAIETIRDLSMLRLATKDMDDIEQVESFYSHFSKRTALPVFNGAEQTFKHMLIIAEDKNLITLLQDILKQDIIGNKKQLQGIANLRD